MTKPPTLQDLGKQYHLAFIHNAQHFVQSSFRVEQTPQGLFLMGQARSKKKGFKKVAKLKQRR